jgi:hypothetical protein
LIRPRANRFAVFAIALLGCATASAQSETLYVIEQLVVSVSATADGSGDRVGQIKSGDRVEVLEHQGEQVRVKLPSGEEGWVRTSYLSAAPPLREQLKARTDELEKLKQEKAKLEADLASARKAASAAASAPAAASPPTATAVSSTTAGVTPGAELPTSAESTLGTSAPTDSSSNSPPLFSDEGIMPSRPTWVVALIAAAVALIVGFALGWRMLDRRIRAKYGGLRIY